MTSKTCISITKPSTHPTVTQPKTRSSSVTTCPSSSATSVCPTSSLASITCPSSPLFKASMHDKTQGIIPSSVKQEKAYIPKSMPSVQERIEPQKPEYSLIHLKHSLEEDTSMAEDETAAGSPTVLNNFREEVSKIYEQQEPPVATFLMTANDMQKNTIVNDTQISPKVCVKKQVVEKIPMKTKSDTGFDRISAVNKEIKTVVKSETALDRTRSNLDFALIRSESKINLEQSLSQIIKPGLTGLKEFMSSKYLISEKEESRLTMLDKDQPFLNNFIDYFIDCDGLRYLGILEQIELDFEDRCKAVLLTAQPNRQLEAEYLRGKLNQIAKFQPSTQQKTLKEFNFPELLCAEIKPLCINYKPKIISIRRIHEYGISMEKYWLRELEEGKDVDYVEVYDIGTQMLAELMAQLFSLLVKSCEFLVQVNEEIRKYRDKYTAHSLITLYSEFRRLLVEEVNAVAETCGFIMVKIPDMTNNEIIDIMTKLYSQVNFVDICICKALRTIVPLITLYDYTRLMQNN